MQCTHSPLALPARCSYLACTEPRPHGVCAGVTRRRRCCCCASQQVGWQRRNRGLGEGRDLAVVYMQASGQGLQHLQGQEGKKGPQSRHSVLAAKHGLLQHDTTRCLPPLVRIKLCSYLHVCIATCCQLLEIKAAARLRSWHCRCHRCGRCLWRCCSCLHRPLRRWPLDGHASAVGGSARLASSKRVEAVAARRGGHSRRRRPVLHCCGAAVASGGGAAGGRSRHVARRGKHRRFTQGKALGCRCFQPAVGALGHQLLQLGLHLLQLGLHRVADTSRQVGRVQGGWTVCGHSDMASS